jgi:hypothetical protein
MLVLLAVSVAGAAVPRPCALRFAAQQPSVGAVVGGRAVPVIRGVSHSASFAGPEPAFSTCRVREVAGQGRARWRLAFKLQRPAAAHASVSCVTDQRVPHRLVLQWPIAYKGAERQFCGWSDGVRLALAAQPSGARTTPRLRWVLPSGRHAWEVAGATPYPCLERQLREVSLGGAPGDFH